MAVNIIKCRHKHLSLQRYQIENVKYANMNSHAPRFNFKCLSDLAVIARFTLENYLTASWSVTKF